ncbi:hypothetical protein B0H17DRAFT_1179208 [Mycena rosella]|uniref:Uncharacterized protein n=1 Tax=Mycena rosella TaxID=1033263 RepID=A0AAD7GIW4_MYCRO|nr:hypothetical protein B0H17DRAFT_1179208 [Mycena rosella]
MGSNGEMDRTLSSLSADAADNRDDAWMMLIARVTRLRVGRAAAKTRRALPGMSADTLRSIVAARLSVSGIKVGHQWKSGRDRVSPGMKALQRPKPTWLKDRLVAVLSLPRHAASWQSFTWRSRGPARGSGPARGEHEAEGDGCSEANDGGRVVKQRD